YGLLVVLIAGCAIQVRGEWRVVRGETGQTGQTFTPHPSPLTTHLATAASPTALTRLGWVTLAFIPSSLMLSVTTYLTTDIAAIPLLWVIPLALYLLSFTLVFARTPLVPHQAMIRWMPAVVVILAVLILQEGTEPLLVVLGLHLVGLFW